MWNFEADAGQIIEAATALAGGDRSNALNWFQHEALTPFGGKTAEVLVQQGRAIDVLRLLDSYAAGAAG